MKVISREQMKNIETTAINNYKVPSIILMENAGRSVAEEALNMLKERGLNPQESKVVVVCGTGNNGGDGAVTARHLHNWGVNTEVVLTRDIFKLFVDDEKVLAKEEEKIALGDTGINLRAIRQMKLEVRVVRDDDLWHRHFAGADLIVDALLGTGLDSRTGVLKPRFKELINTMNELEIPVLSVDIPSGLDCNTGSLVGQAVQADKTVTFVMAKKGFFLSMGPTVTGEVIVREISIPRLLIERLEQVAEDAGSVQETA